MCSKYEKHVAVLVLTYSLYWLLFEFAWMHTVRYYTLKICITMIVLSLGYLVDVKRPHNNFFRIGAVLLAFPFILLNESLPVFFHVRWQFTTYLEYIFFMAVYFEFFHRIHRNVFKAIGYTLISLVVVGFMYEIPWFVFNIGRFTMGSLNYPFIIRSQFFLMPFLFWKFGSSLKKPVVLVAFVPWVMFEIFLAFNFFFFPSWIPRLPTFVFFTIILWNWVHFSRNVIKEPCV